MVLFQTELRLFAEFLTDFLMNITNEMKVTDSKTMECIGMYIF